MKNKRVKVFEKECLSLNHIMVYDLKISGDDENQDYVYVSSPDLQYNLRNGHTIIEVYDKNDFNVKKYSVVARKGPRKYYNLREEDLDVDINFFSTNDPGLVQNKNDYNELIKFQVFGNYSLSPVYQSFNEGNIIKVFRSTYTIGEHAQISYLSTENAWVIANKHVSIFVRNLKDLKVYEFHPSALYKTTCKIAEYWLKFFDKNIQDKSGFIKEVKSKTLCATFVDNQQFDCLVNYERQGLVFHAIVENNLDNATCLPPDQSYAFFFDKWEMDSSPLTNLGEFNNFEDLRKNLVTLQKTISNSTVKDDELGAVLYFVSKNGCEKVVSMAKIETKEALILSYLVKALKLFWKSHENIKSWDESIDTEYNTSFKSYMFYLESLNINDFKGYMTIGQLAFQKLKEDTEMYDILKKNIPNFLSIIYEQIGYESGGFMSSLLNYYGDESHQTQKIKIKNNAKNKKEKGKVIEKPRKEDAIDIMMKNEYIKKTNKIKSENDPIENITESKKDEKEIKSKVVKKNLKNSKSKQQIEEELKTPKVVNLKTQREITPEKTQNLDFKEIESNLKLLLNLVEEQTPHPRVDVPSKTEEIVEKGPENIEEKEVESVVKTLSRENEGSLLPVEPKFINQDCIKKPILQPTKLESELKYNTNTAKKHEKYKTPVKLGQNKVISEKLPKNEFCYQLKTLENELEKPLKSTPNSKGKKRAFISTPRSKEEKNLKSTHNNSSIKEKKMRENYKERAQKTKEDMLKKQMKIENQKKEKKQREEKRKEKELRDKKITETKIKKEVQRKEKLQKEEEKVKMKVEEAKRKEKAIKDAKIQ